VQALLEKEEVTHTMVDQGDHKALGIVDRCIQTIKNAIHRCMEDKHRTKYLNELPRIIKSYNETPHTGIMDLAPAEASEPDNIAALQILNHRKDDVNKTNHQRLEVGDTVRVRNRKGTFERSYDVKYGKQATISSLEGRYAVLSNGEKVDKRRLAKVTAIEEEPVRHQERVKKDAKVRKSRVLGEIRDFNAKGLTEAPLNRKRV
jgi:hypothetical protein